MQVRVGKLKLEIAIKILPSCFPFEFISLFPFFFFFFAVFTHYSTPQSEHFLSVQVQLNTWLFIRVTAKYEIFP